MECNVLAVDNGKLKVIDILPYKSIVWENKWQDTGSSQFVFPKKDYILDTINTGRFVNLYLGSSADLHYIHSVKITADEIWAYGYEAKELLNKCAVMEEYRDGETDANTLVMAAINNYANFSWLDNTQPFLTSLGNINVDGIGYVSLYELLRTVSKAKKRGFCVTMNATTSKGEIYIKSGNDKSELVRFATMLGNARDIVCTRSDKSYCNKVYVIGTDGFIGTATESDIEGETYEAILDLRDTFMKDDMTAEQYQAALDNRAYMSMIARSNTEKIDVGDIDTSEYNSVYFLGSIVSVDIPELGVSTQRRVIAETYTIEGNQIRTKIELGGV